MDRQALGQAVDRQMPVLWAIAAALAASVEDWLLRQRIAA